MLGIADFAPLLRLSDLQLYNAQGNAFDRSAMMMRVRPGLAAWQRGEPLPAADFRAPSELASAYSALLQVVDRDDEARGRGEPTPYPDHVAFVLNYAEDLLRRVPRDVAVATLRAGQPFSPLVAAHGGRAAP